MAISPEVWEKEWDCRLLSIDGFSLLSGWTDDSWCDPESSNRRSVDRGLLDRSESSMIVDWPGTDGNPRNSAFPWRNGYTASRHWWQSLSRWSADSLERARLVPRERSPSATIKPGICINKPRARSFKERSFCGVNLFGGKAARNSRAVMSLVGWQSIEVSFVSQRD